MDPTAIPHIHRYRLLAPYSDVAQSNLTTLVHALPLYPGSANQDSRDILSVLPYEDVFDSQAHSPPVIPPQPSYSNVITIQEARRLRRSRWFRPYYSKLDLFLQQPFDIQFSILEFLHPLDLRSLERTSKGLRTFLRDQSSRPLWENAFARNADHLPPIPERVDVLRWMDLLFGETRCDECGAGNSYTDFTLRCRLCDRCRNQLLIEPRTNLREFIASSWTSATQKYAVPSITRGKTLFRDVLRLSNTVERLRNCPDSDRLAAFQDSTRKMALSIVEHAENCNAWRDEIESSYSFEWVGLRDLVLKKLSRRLISDGFDPRDVETAQADLRNLFQMDAPGSSWIKNTKISDAIWQYVQAHIRPRLREIKIARLERLRQTRIDIRETEVTRAYQFYFKPNMVSPWLWPEIPPVFALFREPTFHEMIYSSPSHTGSSSDAETEDHGSEEEGEEESEHFAHLDSERLVSAFAELAANGWMEQWRWGKMRELASLLPSHTSSSINDTDVTTLDRATSVFWCLGSRYGSYTAGRCLIGWEGAAPHLRCGALRHAWGGRLHFNEKGAEAARECVRMTGVWRGEREREGVTAREMDALDRRFVCANCGLKDYGDVKGRLAMTWRECVAHHIDKTIENHIAHNLAPRFLLLSPKAEAHVKAREHPDPHAKDKGWSCNHCNVHCHKFVIREVAVRHVREVHVMANPVENLDYLYFPNATYRTPRNPITFQESPTLEFQCAKCQARGLAGRLYCASGIQAHLSRKHDLVDDVQLERDILKISNVLYSEPPLSPAAPGSSSGASLDRLPTCVKQ